MSDYHVPVLADEVVKLLEPAPSDIVVDCTAGGGGHALFLADRLDSTGALVAIDQDPAALVATRQKLQNALPKVVVVQSNMRRLAALLDSVGVDRVNRILLDLGVSSHQFDDPGRGFSFRFDAPLDMRMNPAEGQSARELLANSSERELTRIIREYGEEPWAARIAKLIKNARIPIDTTGALSEIVKSAIPKRVWPRDINPATKTFQALRIAVNDELGALREALEQGIERLAVGGRIAVISYHSLEDRIVKQTFLRYSGRCQCPPQLPECRCGAVKQVEIVTRKPIGPDAAEIATNPRARSAKLRVAQRV